jgi:2-polyprenyl-3-methyl-5-hydroxy-6-metoxy-1,4-benzoquinol methylase
LDLAFVTLDDPQLLSVDSTDQAFLRDSEQLGRVYSRRFTEADVERKHAVWREIVRYLQRYVRDDAAVLDIACDRGYFIRHVRAREKWASDIRNVRSLLPTSVQFVQSPGVVLGEHLPAEHFDVVFMSNYLEHLESGERVVEQLRTVAHLLKPTGTVIVLQPNIRLVGDAYWDFIDHKVALTEKSLVEAAEVAGFRTRELITRFLPYTTTSWFPQHPVFVRMYLNVRPAWFLFGKQSLYVGDVRCADFEAESPR